MRLLFYYFIYREVDVGTVINDLLNKKVALMRFQFLLSNICSEIFAPIRAEIMNLSMLQGKFQNNLKLSTILMIHKNEDNSNVENYRPIKCFFQNH